MSLDVYLEEEEVTHEESICGECGNTRKISYNKDLWEGNITHNLVMMAVECGLYEAVWRPEEHDLKYAEQMIPILETGLKKLLQNPSRFEEIEPDNGWGSYDGFRDFIHKYLRACETYPKAIIKVDR
jgi:hypothetical protein